MSLLVGLQWVSALWPLWVTLLGLGVINRRVVGACLLIVGCAGIGLSYGISHHNQRAVLTAYVEAEVTLRGEVKEDPSRGAGESVSVILENLSIGERDIAGSVWMQLSTSEQYVRRYDTIKVTGQMSEGFGTFGASMYRPEILTVERENQGDIAGNVRDSFAEKINRHLPDAEASLGLGFLVGLKQALPAETAETLQVVGLTHIVVASGYNLTILVRVARRLGVKVSRFSALALSLMLIVSFVLVTGFSPSMTRAGLVAGISILVWYVGRKLHPVVLLSVVAAITVFINPAYVWGDVGWMLSFAAFIGVMMVSPVLQAYFFAQRKPGLLRQIIGETFSAQILTLPIILLYFNSVSLVAIFANLLVLPLVPLAMLLTFLTGIADYVTPIVASVIALPTSWLLGYMLNVAEWLGSFWWAQREMTIAPWVAILMYAGIAAVVTLLYKSTGLSLRQHNITE